MEEVSGHHHGAWLVEPQRGVVPVAARARRLAVGHNLGVCRIDVG